MEWQLVVIILVAYAGSFYLVPHQIMLATSNRVGAPFAKFRGTFRFTSVSRVGLAAGGTAATLLLGNFTTPFWTAALFGLTLIALYILDFVQVERSASRMG
ncbi:hypothetical protein [Brevundimonas sp.]|uniref:hypothetical protein n=1 Tax=Brevundimonas sp. TaxID=1871086 RepID=UPI00391CA091